MASPSFVVLPFTNPSRDPDRGYVAANISSDLAAGLSGIADSLVIARGSTVEAQGRAVAEIGRDFGVQYVVRGDAIREGTHLSVTASLVSAETEEVLWTEHFECDFGALQNLEREIVERIARRLDVSLTEAAPSPPLSSMQDVAALEALLRAKAVATMPTTAQTIGEARRLFSLALHSAPLAVEAKAGLAAIHLAIALNGRGGAPAFELRECERLVQEALAVDPRNAGGLNTLGALRRATGKPREALVAFAAAVTADRNDANAHAQIGRLKIDLGEPEQTLSYIEAALRLSPRDAQRSLWFTFAGLALLYTGDVDAAQLWLEKSIAAAPLFVTSQVFLAAALQLHGRAAEARRTIAIAQRLSPAVSVTRVEQQFAPAERTLLQWARIRDSLRAAGLPD